MINKTDLLDPMALEYLSEYEKSVVEGAQNAGYSPRHINTEKIGGRYRSGALQQIINPSAISAAEYGAPGGDSDISDGLADLREALDVDFQKNESGR